ncbi:GNAT family N-acetyltransferase [Pseudactinotalea sp.]|uniref:GNAT family N-acetyltransferase n=1 Tax=Pseudactinotalea sp. TaxID=1926260 RepID=UPI003B3AD802
MRYRIIDVPAPASATEAPDWQARAVADVTSLLDAEVWGVDDFVTTPAEVVAGLAHQESNRKLRSLAVPADVADPTEADVLGVGSVWLPLEDNTASANIWIGVRPRARGHGVGEALWQHALRQVQDEGRTVLQAWSSFGVEPAADDPEAMSAPTGSGRVPGNDPATRFALARGFRLEQAERHSVLELPVSPAALERFRSEAQATAGEDYELIAWGDTVPEERLDSYCVLLRSMSTDAPSAGITWEEEQWTPERVRTSEVNLADQGWHRIVLAALHRPSGELAGYTAIDFKHDQPEVTFQDNTIVRADHRGHRLGMWLKAANLQRLAQERPGSARVHTWNAEENDYMLSINVALGFYPAGGGAAWQLTLPGDAGLASGS